MRASFPSRRFAVTQELRDALRPVAEAADTAARKYLAKTTALQGPKTSKALQDGYRAERRTELQREAQQTLRAHNVAELAARATEALAMKAQLESPDFYLSRARFVIGTPLPVDDNDSSPLNEQRKQHNLLLTVAERLTRADWREELKAATNDELGTYVAEAKATGNAALLRLIDREIKTRRNVPTELKATALPEAKAAILATAPEAKQALGILAEISRSLGRIADADRTIVTTTDHHAKEASARVAELAETHGDQASTIYLAEAAERRQQLERDAAKWADEEIERAIRLDESDAAAVTIPISRNNNVPTTG
jgi:hypothetical protein